MMPQHRTVTQLMHEHPGPDHVIRIGPWKARLNPTDYSEDRHRVMVVVQTAGGYGRYDYGVAPPQYTISGTTGLAGVNGQGGIEQLRQLALQAGRPDTAHQMYFPGEFRGVRFVKVDELHFTRNAQSPYFHDFRLVVSEYPPQLQHPARKVPGAVLGVPLPVGGSSPSSPTISTGTGALSPIQTRHLGGY